MQPFPQDPVKRTGLRLSIKAVVFGALGALSLLAAGQYGWEALESWSVYSRALEQREFSAAADKFIKGTYVILLERLATDNGFG